MRKFRTTLSRKLTLFIVGLLMTIWLAFGSVLVFTTARAILAETYQKSIKQAELYSHNSYILAYSGYRDVKKTNLWVQHAYENAVAGVVYPSTNWNPGRYTEYSFLSQDGQIFVSTALCIRIQNAENHPSLNEVTLLLDGLPAGDFFELSQLFEKSRDQEAPLPPLSATGTRNDRIFKADTLTMGDRTYSTGRTAGADTITLSGDGADGLLPFNAYQLYPPALNSLGDWKRMVEVVERAGMVEGLADSPHSVGRDSWHRWLWAYSAYETEIWPDGWGGWHFDVTSVIISTPLQTALEENVHVLLLTLALVPLLGLLFSSLLRRMVVLPLKKTQQDFDRVAKLDFRGCEGDIERQDEIGDLNRNIRQMAAELQKRWDDERALEARRQEFMAAASHELKTPLALLSGYTEAVAQDIGDKDRYLAAMEGEIDRMNGLVMELLDQTRLERMEELDKTERVDLTALAARLLDQMAPLFTGLDLQVRLEPGVFLPGDGPLLERAMGNLLSNAGKYCSPGGRVEISLRNSVSGPEFRVENETPPIPETELPRLFEPFYRGDKARDRSGSGMGLAIAQKIFTLHHLACWAENTQAGVRFTVSPTP